MKWGIVNWELAKQSQKATSHSFRYALYYIRKYNRSTWFCTYLSSFKYVVEARTIFHSPILLKTMVRNGSRKPMAKTNSLGIGDTPSVLIMLQWPTWQSYP